ncbi:MAG: hypothetical protein HFF07_01335 [Oscillospiraceae bacterium]|nr:hypothetical protein [Oscillospiraceae bacterium]
MRWSKIKNIIILLLVLVNGFLLGQVGLRALRSQQAQRETRERMVAILERNDVSYLPQEVPGALTLPGRRVTLSPPGEAEAALLAGEILRQETLGARTTYQGPRGFVTCSPSGEMEAQFAPGAVPQEELDSLLESLGVRAQESDRQTQGDFVRVTLTQTWEDIPVPSLTVTVLLRNGGVESLTLRRLAGTEELLPARDTLDAATALTRLLDELNRGEGYVCSQISAVYPGYSPSGTGVLTLTPAWFIQTDTWRFVVDGYTGAVTATE